MTSIATAGSHALLAGNRHSFADGATESPQNLAVFKIHERVSFIENRPRRTAICRIDTRKKRFDICKKSKSDTAATAVAARCYRILVDNEDKRFQLQICQCRRDVQERTTEDKEINASADPWGVRAALAVLNFYKREISPLLPGSCRYVPTCSEYSMTAYRKYGVLKGTILTAWRIARCNPLGGSGFDPPRWFGEPPPPS